MYNNNLEGLIVGERSTVFSQLDRRPYYSTVSYCTSVTLGGAHDVNSWPTKKDSVHPGDRHVFGTVGTQQVQYCSEISENLKNKQY